MTVFNVNFDIDKLPTKIRDTGLIVKYNKGIIFDPDKITVIVGPNASGKTLLLSTLAQLLCCYDTGTTIFNRSLIEDRYYTKKKPVKFFDCDREYISGFSIASDNSQGYYYTPGMLPGHSSNLAHALCAGYDIKPILTAAAVLGVKAEQLSTGQMNKILLEQRLKYLTSDPIDAGIFSETFSQSVEHFASDKLEALFQKAPKTFNSKRPVFLLDEPESGLDRKSVKHLWERLDQTDLATRQIIVATHNWGYENILPDEKVQVIDFTL